MTKRSTTFVLQQLVMTLMKMNLLLLLTMMTLQSHTIVHAGPLVAHLEHNVTAKSGTPLILPCGVPHNPGATCQWTKDGFGLGQDDELPGWPRYSMVDCALHVDPVLPTDERVYVCQVGAEVAHPVVVHVVSQPGPPYIEEARMENVMEVGEGEKVELNCESQGGSSPAEILWREVDIEEGGMEFVDVVNRVEPSKDGKSFKTRSTLKFVPRKSLWITCSAFNEEFRQPKTSRPIEIVVKSKPDVEMVFDKTSVVEGGSIEVNCMVNKLEEDLTYNWFVNDQQIEGFKGTVLKLDPVARNQNNAEIKCSVRNSVGLTEVTKTLDVKFPPTLVKQPQGKNVQTGEMVKLECAAQGNPQPKYVWFKGKSSKLVGEGSQLSLVASDQTEGEYTCKVYSEGFQSVSSSAALVAIMRRPKISAELVKHANLDNKVILQCKVYSFSEQTKVLWTKNHDPIDENSEKYEVLHSTEDNNVIKSELVIFKMTNDDFSDYGCFASNQIGTDYRTISIKEEKAVNYIFVLVCFCVVVVLILLCLVIFYHRKKLIRQKEKVKRQISHPIYKTTVMPLFKNEDIGVLDKLLLEGEKETNKNLSVCEINMALNSSFG